jgi:hypothetical protein
MVSTVTAFLAGREIASGERDAVTRMLEERYSDAHSEILVFDDNSGRVTDLDYWDALKSASPRGPGRPKLGVTPREVTLLPRHWEWLATQPGGASAALRRLIDEARRQGRSDRERQDAAYSFMQAMCGDRPNYEAALRALYKAQRDEFFRLVKDWPDDVRRYLARLLGAEDRVMGPSCE